MLCVFPLLSTCCSQKTFHPHSWPEAAFPPRPERLCDLLQVLECLKLISRTQWEIPAAKPEYSPLSFVYKCCLVLHLSHTDLEHSCRGCFFFPYFPNRAMNDLLLLSVGIVFCREHGLKIITLITWNYFCHLKARGIQTWRYAPANVLLLVFLNLMLSFYIKVERFHVFYCVFPVYFVCRVWLLRNNILPWSLNLKNRWKYFSRQHFFCNAVQIDGALLIGLNRMS